MADSAKELPPGAFPKVTGIPKMSLAAWKPPPETQAAAQTLLGLPSEKYQPPDKDVPDATPGKQR